MASADMAPSTPSTPSTPTPALNARTPPAPRLGFHDNWEPFSPRKSARLSSQRARTPSPPPAHRQQLASPRTAKKANSEKTAAMVSPVSSPRKKRQPAADSIRRVSGSLTSDGTASAAAALGFKDKPAGKSATTSVSRSVGMLPTPSKTPQKPPNAKTAADIQAFARNLFPSEDAAISTPRKKRTKKYSMGNFKVDEVDESIEIFTDSQNRIPKKDESESNPFYGDTAQPESAKRRSKRRQVMIPGEGAQSIDQASRREDGMVYVFRGKKFFRKFSELEDAQSEEPGESGPDVEHLLSRPLTRSSIKPRLLFPTQQKTKEMLEEEEAATDVEDLHMADTQVNPQTPMKAKYERAQTPEAPKFAPASPPDTRRTTRSTNKLVEQATPMKRTGRKSPFDAWPRIKDYKAQQASKRAGESLASDNAKRTRT